MQGRIAIRPIDPNAEPPRPRPSSKSPRISRLMALAILTVTKGKPDIHEKRLRPIRNRLHNVCKLSMKVVSDRRKSHRKVNISLDLGSDDRGLGHDMIESGERQVVSVGVVTPMTCVAFAIGSFERKQRGRLNR